MICFYHSSIIEINYKNIKEVELIVLMFFIIYFFNFSENTERVNMLVKSVTDNTFRISQFRSNEELIRQYLMFSCVNSIDSIVEGELNGNTTLDRVLEEAGKLKRKCKSLRTLLLETETKRSEEKEEYDLQIIALKQELDTKVSNLQAQSYIEVIIYIVFGNIFI